MCDCPHSLAADINSIRDVNQPMSLSAAGSFEYDGEFHTLQSGVYTGEFDTLSSGIFDIFGSLLGGGKKTDSFDQNYQTMMATYNAQLEAGKKADATKLAAQQAQVQSQANAAISAAQQGINPMMIALIGGAGLVVAAGLLVYLRKGR